MNNAYELFTAVPKKHNCAQAVADGFGFSEMAAAMQTCGGGKAPLGRCGALHAALELTDKAHHARIIAEFTALAKAETCQGIKSAAEPFPCKECVRLAAELVEKYR
jgi:hypothetical protein